MSNQYTVLAPYYDALVKDETATKHWVEFTKKHIIKKNILELACGSAEITCALHKEGYNMFATDISSEMIGVAKEKNPEIHFEVMDMLNIQTNSKFDGIICFCDSFNYMNSIDEVKQFIGGCLDKLEKNGALLFDMHTVDRLSEFEDEFFEEGQIEDVQYQWSISSEENRVLHSFHFWKDEQVFTEQHIQTVFSIEEINDVLKNFNCTYEIFMDYDIEFLCENEKVFYVIKKGE